MRRYYHCEVIAIGVVPAAVIVVASIGGQDSWTTRGPGVRGGRSAEHRHGGDPDVRDVDTAAAARDIAALERAREANPENLRVIAEPR